jgi:precorrin-3B synthase
VLDPMETGDGWLLRIRVPGGSLTPAAMHTVAGVADRFGSGAIELTSRANLQIRGVRAAHLDEAAVRLVEAGLALPDPERDARRAIVASPLADHDARAVRGGVAALVADIERRLVEQVVGAVPTKFGIVVDDEGSWSLEHLDADLRIEAGDDPAWRLRLRGEAEPLGVVDDPAASAVTIAQLCADRAARIDIVVATLGRLAISNALAARKGSSRGEGTARRADVDPSMVNVVAAPFLGRIDATTLERIGVLAGTHGLVVRLTTRHSIAFCRVARAHLPAVTAALVALGLSLDPADPRALVSACVGSRGCRSAHADTWAEAERIVDAGFTTRVHLSGCEKRCGAPAGVTHLVSDSAGRFCDAGALR